MSLHRYCFFECALAQTHSKKQYPSRSYYEIFASPIICSHISILAVNGFANFVIILIIFLFVSLCII